MSTDNDKGPSPELVLTDGALRAASWREEGEYGPFFNTKITRRYTNADGEVRETTSLRERDLLPASALAAEAHRTIRNRKRELAQDRTEVQAKSSDQNEEWWPEDMTPREIAQARFKKDRQPRAKGHSKPRGHDQDY